MGKNFIVIKDFDKRGTLSLDFDNDFNPTELVHLCTAAAPSWLEVVVLGGPTKEQAFEIYSEYSPTKDVLRKELLEACMSGEYDFGEWLVHPQPVHTGWKNQR